MNKRNFIILSIFLFAIAFLTGCCCCCSDLSSFLEKNPTPDNNNPGPTPVPVINNDGTRTLKALIVICDDYINPENNAIAGGLKINLHNIKRFLEILKNRNIVKVEKIILQGRDATDFNIKKELENLTIQESDILFFYYGGHGGMENGRLFLWPCNEENLYRDEIQSIVASKNAALSFILTDACSSSIDSVGYTNLLNYMGDMVNENANDEIYRHLFLEYRGTLDLTAATEGQYAWFDGRGGYFSRSLIKEILIQRPLPDWEEIVKEAIKKTEDKYRESENLGFVPEEDINTMDTQTPKAYSIPVREEEYKGNNDYFTKPPDTSEKEIRVIIKNNVSYEVKFYIDDNPDNKNWSKDNCQEKLIKHGEGITVKNNRLIKVFYDKGNGTRDYYDLERGNYYFSLDKNNFLQLYVGDPSEKPSGKKKIMILNFDYNQVDFKIEYNPDSSEDYSLQPNDYVNLNTEKDVNIYFNGISYILYPEKTYYFSKNACGETALYKSQGSNL